MAICFYNFGKSCPSLPICYSINLEIGLGKDSLLYMILSMHVRYIYIYTILLVTTSCLADYQTVDKFGFHSEKYDNQGFC